MKVAFREMYPRILRAHFGKHWSVPLLPHMVHSYILKKEETVSCETRVHIYLPIWRNIAEDHKLHFSTYLLLYGKVQYKKMS